MSARRAADLSPDDVRLAGAGAGALRVAFVLGLAGLAVGIGAGFAEGDGLARFWHAWLLNVAYFASLALGALFFVLIQHTTRAGWSVAIRRVAEAVSNGIIVPVALFAIPLVLGLRSLYEWADPAKVAEDHLLHGKAAYLNVPFFLARSGAYFIAWGALAWWFWKRSTEQDATGDPRVTIEMERVAPAGLLAFGLTATFFAFDWLMALTPHWYSTIFGVYFFAGSVVGFFALNPLLALWLQRRGRLTRTVSVEHLHDMGKLTFAFVIFWAYIGFSQFMLMWYANLPEETVWYRPRMAAWAPVSWMLLFGHFLAPFLFLMSRHMKRRTATLRIGAAWVLVMHWLDIAWLVMPKLSPDHVLLGLPEIALAIGMGGICFAALGRRLGRHALVPIRDPRLPESLRFENI